MKQWLCFRGDLVSAPVPWIITSLIFIWPNGGKTRIWRKNWKKFKIKSSRAKTGWRSWETQQNWTMIGKNTKVLIGELLTACPLKVMAYCLQNSKQSQSLIPKKTTKFGYFRKIKDFWWQKSLAKTGPLWRIKIQIVNFIQKFSVSKWTSMEKSKSNLSQVCGCVKVSEQSTQM